MRVALAVLVACAHAPDRAFAPVEPRPRAAHDQGLAVIYDASVCSFTLDARTVAMLDHVFTTTPLVAVTPLPPGRYTLTGVAIGKASSFKRDGVDYVYTDCSAATTDALDVPVAITADALTLVALPAGAPTLVDLDGVSLDEPTVRAREAAWLPSLATAVQDARAKLVAAKRQARDGYDVYPDCGLFGAGTAVVRATGTPLTDALAPPHPITASQYANHRDRGCIAELAEHVVIGDPAELDRAIAEAGAWLVDHDVHGEIDIVVRPPPPAS